MPGKSAEGKLHFSRGTEISDSQSVCKVGSSLPPGLLGVFPQNTESLVWSCQAEHHVKGCPHMQRHPRTSGSQERAEHWSFCPEVSVVCNTHSLVHNQHTGEGSGAHLRLSPLHFYD